MERLPLRRSLLVALFVAVTWAAATFAVAGLLAVLLDRDPVETNAGPVYVGLIGLTLAGVVVWLTVGFTARAPSPWFGALGAAASVYLVIVGCRAARVVPDVRRAGVESRSSSRRPLSRPSPSSRPGRLCGRPPKVDCRAAHRARNLEPRGGLRTLLHAFPHRGARKSDGLVGGEMSSLSEILIIRGLMPITSLDVISGDPTQRRSARARTRRRGCRQRESGRLGSRCATRICRSST